MDSALDECVPASSPATNVLPSEADEALTCVSEIQFMSSFSIFTCMTKFVFKSASSDKHKYSTPSKR